MAELSQPQFWVAIVQIIWIDIVLSGDNALVIAMACRDLRPRERRLGLIIGASSAAVLLVMFTISISALMQLVGLHIVAAGALIFIAVRLLGAPPRQAGVPQTAQSLWRAVRLIVAADVIMSLDNAVAVAAVAKGRYVLLALGLAISIPIVMVGSAIVAALIGRFPIIVWVGGAILGFVAGELFASDPLVAPRAAALLQTILGLDARVAAAVQGFEAASGLDATEVVFGFLGAVVVIILARVLRRARARHLG